MKRSYWIEDSVGLRQQLMADYVIPAVATSFAHYPQLESATLLVGQYDCGEAHDAVHHYFLYSVLDQPDLVAAIACLDDLGHDSVNLPGLPPHHDISDCFAHDQTHWDANGRAIQAFACYCQPDCHLGMSLGQIFRPYAVFHRHGEDIEVELVGEILQLSCSSAA